MRFDVAVNAPSSEVLTLTEARRQIMALEEGIKELPSAAIKTDHIFAPGVYIRKLFIPAGTVLTGKIHKHRHANIISQGHIRVFTPEGPAEIQAPAEVISIPGTKRAGFAVEDTVWLCVHPNPTNETDPDKLEAMFISPSFEAFDKEAVMIEDQS